VKRVTRRAAALETWHCAVAESWLWRYKRFFAGIAPYLRSNLCRKCSSFNDCNRTSKNNATQRQMKSYENNRHISEGLKYSQMQIKHLNHAEKHVNRKHMLTHAYRYAWQTN